MKFDCGLSLSDKIEIQKKWHRWFAWRPVRVAPHDCRWLEYVERKIMITRYGVETEYRVPGGE